MSPLPESAVVLNLALALVESSAAPLLLLDNDLKIVAASASFAQTFQLDPAALPGSSLAELGAGEWSLPQLASLLRATASGFSEIAAYEMDLARPGRVTRCLVLNARKLAYDGVDQVRLILSVADITDARAAQKLKESLLREKDILLQELHHRVANSLQIIASVLMQSARKVQSAESRVHLSDAHQRVMSVAALQKQLSASRLGDVELRPYFNALCESIGAAMISDRDLVRLEVTTDSSVTTADTSVSLGLIITELVINALKHAFPENRAGRIVVDYRAQGPNWTLSVSDDGVGMPSVAGGGQPGLGTSIVQALASQLTAAVSITGTSPGTTVAVAHHHVPVLVGQTAALRAV